MNAPAPEGGSRRRLAIWLVSVGFALALISALAAVFSGLGYRLDLWPFRTGFKIIRWSFFGGLAALVLSLIGVFLPSRRGATTLAMGILGIVIGGIVAYVPWSWKQTLDALPYIHDITTDTENPPAFVAVAAVRGPSDHPVAYDGPETAAKQHEAYPDVRPYFTRASPQKVYEQSKVVIAGMGMDLVDSDEQEGRIEATASSLLYGFKDDMVVRITPGPDGTRVDVRSKSRLGRSDFGQNAKRIVAFIAGLKSALGDAG